jgi:hypothetical protein
MFFWKTIVVSDSFDIFKQKKHEKSTQLNFLGYTTAFFRAPQTEFQKNHEKSKDQKSFFWGKKK